MELMNQPDESAVIGENRCGPGRVSDAAVTVIRAGRTQGVHDAE